MSAPDSHRNQLHVQAVVQAATQPTMRKQRLIINKQRSNRASTLPLIPKISLKLILILKYLTSYFFLLWKTSSNIKT
jgi:hypothetical protein